MISSVHCPFIEWLRWHVKLVIQVYCLLEFELNGLPRLRLKFRDLLALHSPVQGVLEGSYRRLLILMNNHVSFLWLYLDLWSMNCPWLLIDDLRHVNGWKNLHFAEFFFIAISAIGENIWLGSPLFILDEPLQLVSMLFQGLIINGFAEMIMRKSSVLINLPVGRDFWLPFFRISLLGPVKEFWRHLWVFLFQTFCRRQVELQILIWASDSLLRFYLDAKIGRC